MPQLVIAWVAEYLVVSITVATLIVDTAIILGGMALSSAQRRSAEKKAKDAYNASQVDRMQNVVTTVGQRELVLGRVRKAGTVFARASTGTNKETFVMCVAIAAHEIDAVETIYLNDVAVTLDASGNVTTAPYAIAKRTAAIQPFTGSSTTLSGTIDPTSVIVTRDDGSAVDGSGSTPVPFTLSGNIVTITDGSSDGKVSYQTVDAPSKAKITVHLGTAGQAADADLMALFPTDWTINHTASGVAYLVCQFTYDETAFPSGIPNVSAVVRGAKLYDPRTGATAWSENPALMARYLLAHPSFGKRSSITAAEDARIIAAANACDTTVGYVVNGVTTTRALYTAGTVIPYGNPTKAALDDICQAMAGMWAYAAGQFYVRAGIYSAPVLTLTDADTAVVKRGNDGSVQQQPINITTHKARANKINVITPRIWDSAQDYKQVALTPLVASTLVTRDGAWLAQEVTLAAVTYAPQALHIAGVTIRDDRDPLQVTLPFKLSAYRVEMFDTIALTIARYGWTAKEFIVLGRTWTLDGLIQLTLKETASLIFQMDAAFSPQGYAANTNLPKPWQISPPTITSIASGNANLEVKADGTIITRVRVDWTPITDASLINGGQLEIWYRLASQTTWATLLVPATTTYVYLYGANPGDVGVLQARTRNDVAVSDWTPLQSHTVTGKTGTPGTVTSLTAVGIEHGIRISGVLPTDVDLAYIEVWAGTTNVLGSATLRAQGLQSTWDWIGLTAANGTQYIWVRAVNSSGVVGAFTGPVSAVAGISATPGNVTSLAATGIIGGIRLTGVLPTDLDLAYVEIWMGTTNVIGSATKVTQGLATRYDQMGLTAADGVRYFWARAVNSSGAVGSYVGPVSATAGVSMGAVTGLTATGIAEGIRISGTLPTNPDLAYVEVYMGTTNVLGSATLITRGLASSYDKLGLTVADGVRYFWVRCVSTSAVAGSYTGPVSATAGQAVGDVTGLAATSIAGGIRITGTLPTNPDLAYVELSMGTTNVLGSATVVAKGLSNKFDQMGLTVADGIRYFWARCFNASGNAGNYVGPVSATAIAQAWSNVSGAGKPADNADVTSTIMTTTGVALSGSSGGFTWNMVVNSGNTTNGGVIGYTTTSYGINGVATANGGVGVWGDASGASSNGVVGTGTTGRGVYGNITQSGGRGVHGLSTHSGGIGVRAENSGGGTALQVVGSMTINNNTKVANLNADFLDGLDTGNASGSIPINNGTVNTNLNADMVDGLHASSFALQSAMNKALIYQNTSAPTNTTTPAGWVKMQSSDGTVTAWFQYYV